MQHEIATLLGQTVIVWAIIVTALAVGWGLLSGLFVVGWSRLRADAKRKEDFIRLDLETEQQIRGEQR